MKIIYGLVFLLLSSIGFAGNENHVARLSLNLDIEKLCDDNVPFCVDSRIITIRGVEVPLTPQDGDQICTTDPTTTNCDLENVTHYRGLWSKVVEKDGIRSIAIVSIDKHLYQNDDPEDNSDDDFFYYSIEAEILGEKGPEAKIRIGTDDLKKLNGVTLEGSIRNVMHNSYQSTLYIGPSIYLIPTPCLPNHPHGHCDDDVSNEKKFFKNTVEVLLGTIK